jgi:hypothetical protein
MERDKDDVSCNDGDDLLGCNWTLEDEALVLALDFDNLDVEWSDNVPGQDQNGVFSNVTDSKRELDVMSPQVRKSSTHETSPAMKLTTVLIWFHRARLSALVALGLPTMICPAGSISWLKFFGELPSIKSLPQKPWSVHFGQL